MNLIRVLPVIFLLGGLCSQVRADPMEQWYIAPGKMIDVGGYRLHIYCTGEGTPTVILDAGMGGFSLDWYRVQQSVSMKTRVCSYDRAGYGWSEPGPPPRTTDHIVEELYTLLDNSGNKPPYILVGHSFGGYNMQYYTRLYPDQVAGLVLVDSSHPDQAERLPEIPSVREKSRAGKIVTVFVGQNTLQYYPEEIRFKVLPLLTQRKVNITHRRESVNFVMSGYQVAHAAAFPDIPLIVISRGLHAWPDDPYGNMLESVWADMQKELAGLSPHGRQIIATRSKHLIHLEQPDLVSAAIESLLDEPEQKLPLHETHMACMPEQPASVDC